MFSYPSAAKLHLGHWFNFAPSDSYARFKSMQGYNVFHPMGFDAFGLPAENYAIKTGIHPHDSTVKNIESMKKQLEAIGISPKVMVLKDNDDPDTYILKNGRESFESLIYSAVNFSDYKIDNLKTGVNFNSDIELANYVDSVLKETSLIKDEIRQEIILKKLAIECNLSYNTLEKRLTKYVDKSNIKMPVVSNKSKEARLTKYEKAIFALFYAMLNNTDVIDKCKRDNVCFVIPKNRYLYNEILYFYERYGDINIADMYTYLADKEELLALLNDINKTEDYDCSNVAVADYIQVIKDYNMKQEIKRLNELMKKENNILEKSKIAEQIRLIKVGENSHG